MASHVYVKNPNGTTYVYENVSYWDKEDKKTKHRRKCVGKIDPDTKEVIPTGKKTNAKPDGALQKTEHCQILTTGPSLLLDKAAAQTRLSMVLRAVFPEDYQGILACAYYLASEGKALCHAEQWSSRSKHPYGGKLADQRISELLNRLDPSKQQDFFSKWANLNHDGGYFALDITSVSSYSELIDFVRRGYNRDGDDIYATTELSKWKGHRCYKHVYFDSLKAELENKKFTHRLKECYDALCSGSEKAEDAGFISKYYLVTTYPKRRRRIEYNEDAIREHKESNTGWFVLISNDIKDAAEALRAYRQKDAVEKNFDDLKNDLDMKRLCIHTNATMEGRIFIQFISLILTTYLKGIMDKNGWTRNHSLQEIFSEMKSLKQVTVDGKRKKLTTTSTAFQQSIMELYQVTP